MMSKENQSLNTEVRRAKRDSQFLDSYSQANNYKRAALGTICNNIRIQPLRAAKVGSCSIFHHTDIGNESNIAISTLPFGKSSNEKQAFSIHVDSDNKDEKKLNRIIENNLDTSSTNPLTSLNLGLRKPLCELPLEVETCSLDDSTMTIDLISDHHENHCIRSNLEEFSLVKDYAYDIFIHMKEMQKKYHPKYNYMKKQSDITPNMRCILIDWLVEVCEEYKLHNETLYLAVSYIDRFLSSMSVLRSKLQLVGTASMFIASKFEEIYPPEIGEFVYITDDTYSKKQVLRMEHLILKVLSFDMSVPTANFFLSNYLKELNTDSKTQYLAMYLTELTLQEYEFIKFLPSIIAASALFLSMHTLEKDTKPSSFLKNIDISHAETELCLNELYNCFHKSSNCPQQAVREKYKSPSFLQVSLVPPPKDCPLLTDYLNTRKC